MMNKSPTKRQAVFLSGSTMRHTLVMSFTATLGLMTLFIVDLVDMYFLSLLGEIAIASAIGYAGTILFFTTSISIGVAIATGALVSRSLGANQQELASRYASHTLAYGFVLALLVTAITWWQVPNLLALLGAKGQALELASQYLRIIIPSMPILIIGMSSNGVLRANGDAKRAMWSTVIGGIVNAVLDPIFIFALDLGVQGAAIASVIARISVFLYAFNAITRVHNLLQPIQWQQFFADTRIISKIALPAILTNIATPLGNAYVIKAVATYGDSVVAGMSIVGRITPVAFGIVFALSGAIGPIIGQNFGAKQFPRIRSTIRDALIVSVVSVITMSILLWLLQDYIISAFNADAEAAAIIQLFCQFLAIMFIFNGMQFVANATFNNIGFPHYSTFFNFLKASLGTIPFVWLGGLWYGANGILIGQALGAAVVGMIALAVCIRQVSHCSSGNIDGQKPKRFSLRMPHWPQSNTRG